MQGRARRVRSGHSANGEARRALDQHLDQAPVKSTTDAPAASALGYVDGGLTRCLVGGPFAKLTALGVSEHLAAFADGDDQVMAAIVVDPVEGALPVLARRRLEIERRRRGGDRRVVDRRDLLEMGAFGVDDLHPRLIAAMMVASMPELPEVETVRRQLEPEIRGRRIGSAEVLDERWTRPESPASVEAGVAGRTVEAVERRGKYLIVRLDNGSALVMHLRMTGNLLLRPAGLSETADLMEVGRFGAPRLYESHPEARHLRARFVLDDDSELWFTDARRFGHGHLLAADEIEPYFDARLGPEPLGEELTAAAIAERAADRRAPLKSFLLNQAVIAGIGNIYADEALFRAELHPLSQAGSMKLEHCEALREGIVEALEAGLENGGASIDDYRNVVGERGSMQDEFLVHTREGQECHRCGGEIERVVVGGRSTYFCPGCQLKLRARPRRRPKSRRR